MRKNLVHIGLPILLSAILFIAACGPKDSTEGSGGTESTPIVVVAEATIEVQNATAVKSDISLDPAKTTDEDSLFVSSYLYEGLVTVDAEGNIQPGIAESWTVSDDELDYIFEINPKAHFSDGSRISVDVIADNFNRWFDPKSPYHGDGNFPNWLNRFLAFNGERGGGDIPVSQVDGVQKVDINTFIVHLNRLEPQLLTYLAEPAFAILSPSALENPAYGTSQSTIISSGVYVVTSWTDEGMTLTPNPQYWNTAAEDELKFIWK